MKIHIFGASGSGTTTLAKEISEKLDFFHLDADDYYWRKTDPPYQEKIPLGERGEALKRDVEKFEKVVVSGSLVTWGEYWLSAFDLAIFLLIPQNIRMERLIKREMVRYGKELETNAEIIETSKAFLDWAKKYDDPNFDGRSITQHLNWIDLMHCQVLKIEEDLTVEEGIDLVQSKLESFTST